MNTAILFFLALQGTLAFIGAEVGVRYARWFWETIRDHEQQLMLRTMLLGIAFTHIAIGVDNGYWIVAHIHDPNAMSSLHLLLNGSLGEMVLSKAVLLAGVILHLVPVWKITKEYSWTRIWVCISLRLALAGGLYLFGLSFAHVLVRYL